MKGFTLTELIVAMVISMIVCGALLLLASDARTMFRIQPETADLLQRARVAHEVIGDALAAAGGGPQSGRDPQPLVHWIPPVLPYVRTVSGPGGSSDPERQAFTDRVTLITVPDQAPHASIDGATTAAGDLVPIVRDADCGSLDVACGFAEGQRVLLFDATPAFDVATVRGVSPSELRLDPGNASKIYHAADGARVVVARVTTFTFDASKRQLKRAMGDGVDAPALDQVAELSFRYFGDAYPPKSPRPPPGEANCLFNADGSSRLPVLAADGDGLIELPVASLADGPFCGEAPYRFDADAYRVRRVHVRLRVQTVSAWLRGLDPRFVRVPDLVTEFDIAPRSLQAR